MAKSGSARWGCPASTARTLSKLLTRFWAARPKHNKADDSTIDWAGNNACLNDFVDRMRTDRSILTAYGLSRPRIAFNHFRVCTVLQHQHFDVSQITVPLATESIRQWHASWALKHPIHCLRSFSALENVDATMAIRITIRYRNSG